MHRLLCLLPALLALPACQNAGMAAPGLELSREGALSYEPSTRYPFGRPHPDAPAELQQFAFMVGKNDCTEERLDNASGEWIPGTRTWDAHYFINGNAIRDSGRSGSATNGNIRIFDTASGQWHVTYFSTPVYGSGVWSGGLVEDRLELEQPQKAPGTDLDGINRLTFFNMTDSSLDWKGEWVSLDGSAVFPYWRISCEKVE